MSGIRPARQKATPNCRTLNVNPAFIGFFNRLLADASHPLDDILRHGPNTDERRERWSAYRAALANRRMGRQPGSCQQSHAQMDGKELEFCHEP
jgi:hypothetical protein